MSSAASTPQLAVCFPSSQIVRLGELCLYYKGNLNRERACRIDLRKKKAEMAEHNSMRLAGEQHEEKHAERVPNRERERLECLERTSVTEALVV